MFCCLMFGSLMFGRRCLMFGNAFAFWVADYMRRLGRHPPLWRARVEPGGGPLSPRTSRGAPDVFHVEEAAIMREATDGTF